VIVGKIQISNNIAIGANSYVAQSFLEEGITIAGSPAKKSEGGHTDFAVFSAQLIS
jgi:serine O-acetyltransferase